ncbi:MAG: hypothetical protein HY318_20250 [Armatimonadetes bacterium]|nr:hypothetical protein [Armatimonadota bacterium]
MVRGGKEIAGLGKRKVIVVGLLFLVVASYGVWRWCLSPETNWRRIETRRTKFEQELAKGKRARPTEEKTAIRDLLAGYERFIQRFPKSPKTAAARVIVVGLLERLNPHDPAVLKVRAGLIDFLGDERAAAQVEKLLTDSMFCNIAAEALAGMRVSSFKPPHTKNLSSVYMTEGAEGSIAADVGETGEEVPLPLSPLQELVAGLQEWRHDLGKVAFATQALRYDPGKRWDSYPEAGIRWTIWVADIKKGRLRAFFPSKPMPDLSTMDSALLAWSADGKQLKCGGETFVLEGG